MSGCNKSAVMLDRYQFLVTVSVINIAALLLGQILMQGHDEMINYAIQLYSATKSTNLSM